MIPLGVEVPRDGHGFATWIRWWHSVEETTEYAGMFAEALLEGEDNFWFDVRQISHQPAAPWLSSGGKSVRLQRLPVDSRVLAGDDSGMTREMTRIANPIYDGAFKYLLDDNRVARFFLSVLLGEEIVDLQLRPTEHCTDIERRCVTVFRIDFAARIRSSDGAEKLVIIEIQKAKYATDIMRFRKYLGQQYASDNNMREEPAPVRALPILSIYLLGHKLDHLREPVIRVTRQYRDMNGKAIDGPREEFIESLTHDSIVVQIPLLKPSRQTDLERLLGLFDQSQSDPDNAHMLSIVDEDYPEKFLPVVRRLMKAISEPAVRDTMQVEDDYLGELESLERAIAHREDIIAMRDDVIAEKEGVIAEKDARLHRAVAAMVAKGIPEDEARRIVMG